MDLSFARLDRDVAVTAMPTQLAVLMVGVAARQAASFTAIVQARLTSGAEETGLLAPSHGTFHRAAARVLARWQQE